MSAEPKAYEQGDVRLGETGGVPPKIAIRGLDRSFPQKTGQKSKERFYALKNFELTVNKGEFITIVGPSGCGKSTLLDLLVGLTHGDRGVIEIDGKPMSGPDLEVGIVLQGYALFPWRTVRRNVEFGLEMKGVPAKRRTALSDKYIKLVGLEGFENHYPYELSGGMKQRVAISRALAYDPEVLLMDEPFAAVDAQTREIMQDELLSIWEKTGKTIIFVTHNIEEAIGLADRVAVMTKSPGAIKEVVKVDLPRPRRIGDVRSSTQFSLLSRHIWELLQDRVQYRSPAESKSVYDNVENEIQPGIVI